MKKEQLMEWLSNPTTIQIFEELKEARQVLIDSLVSGMTVGDTADSTHGSTARTIGYIAGIDQLLEINKEEVQ